MDCYHRLHLISGLWNTARDTARKDEFGRENKSINILQEDMSRRASSRRSSCRSNTCSSVQDRSFEIHLCKPRFTHLICFCNVLDNIPISLLLPAAVQYKTMREIEEKTVPWSVIHESQHEAEDKTVPWSVIYESEHEVENKTVPWSGMHESEQAA